jgi:hypothetical protein
MRACFARSTEARIEAPYMLSRDLAVIRRRRALAAAPSKPLPIVDSVENLPSEVGRASAGNFGVLQNLSRDELLEVNVHR